MNRPAHRRSVLSASSPTSRSWHPYKVPYILPSDYPTRIVVLSERSGAKDPSSLAEATRYNLPYILPSSVSSNPCVFTLFTKLPGCTYFLPNLELATQPQFTQFASCVSDRDTPSPCLVFSRTYNSSNLQALCFDDVATVGWGGYPSRPNIRACARRHPARRCRFSGDFSRHEVDWAMK